MKYILLFALISFSTVIFGQRFTTPLNAVLEGNAREASLTEAISRDVSKSVLRIQYFDGLGKPLQSLNVQGSPLKRDIIESFVSYDYMGRQATSSLPMPSRDFNGAFQSVTSLDYYGFYKNTNAYSSVQSFDNDPTSRILSQMNPGGGAKSINTKYESDNGELIRYDVSDEGNISKVTGAGSYTGGTVRKKTYLDEDNHETIEYTDNQGLMIQKSVKYGTGTSDYISIRYLYDIMGRLRYVIPPMQVTSLPTTMTRSEALQNGSLYIYEYDERGRVIQKFLPDGGKTDWGTAGSITYIYDKLDRVVFSQTTMQFQRGKWSFFKYDKQGRPISNGEFSSQYWSSNMRSALESWQQNHPIYEEYTGVGAFGYTSQSLPYVTDGDVKLATYYDNYAWVNISQYGFETNTSYPASAYMNATGLITGHKSTSAALIDVNYYDDNGRVIQQKYNHNLGAINTVFNKYNFAGELLESTTTYRQYGKTDLNVVTAYIKDHNGRTKQMTHKVGSNTLQNVKYDYDEIGRLSAKKIMKSSSPTVVYSLLSVKLLLQGAFDINSPIMTGNLKAQNIIPKNEPYSLYNKYKFIDPSENKSLESVVMNALDGNEIVDWIVVELRDLPNRVVANKAFVLRRDGNLVNPEDGSTTLKMKIPSGSYYISVRHRNHIPVMTQSSIALNTSNPTLIDFINSPSLYTISGITAPVKVINGKSMLWAGDTDNDNQVASVDASNISNDIFYSPENPYWTSSFILNKSYSLSDVNLDSKVIYTGPNNDQDLIVYNIASHPDNPQQSSSFVIKSAIPTSTFNAYQPTDILQKIDFQYHLGGGISCVNCDVSQGIDLNANENDLFAFKLLRNEVMGGYNNGNITQQSWLSKSDFNPRNYSYTYDLANRLTSATYNSYSNISEKYSLENITYDLNGNIKTMKRHGKLSSGFGLIDNLTYNYMYNSNKLSNVNDAVTGNLDVGDFRDNNTGVDDYEYWFDGSLKKDKNKGISDITYNYFNLPEVITLDNGKKVYFTYDGTGKKLEKSVYLNNQILTSTAYVGGMVYEKDIVSNTYNYYQLSMDEGRVVFDNNTWVYEWNYVDHLGNNRLSFREVNGLASIVQSQNYDPWGVVLKDAGQIVSTVPNKFLFNGKEIQSEVGMYDFGARMLDPTIGRWFVVDPLAEKMRRWSPYNYAFDNPLRFIDPDGMVPGEYYNEQGTKIGDDGKRDNKVFVIKTTQTNMNPNNTPGVSSSNPITMEAASTTENEIRNSNFSGEHMKNLVQIESASNMSKMLDIVSKDDGTGGGKPENNREYGGVVTKGGVVKEAKPGAVSDLSTSSNASITIPSNNDTKSKFHSHPSGVLRTYLPNNRINTRHYEQAPSMTDVNGMSGRKIDYEFGMRANTIFIYNKTGVIATIPFSTFKKP